MLPGKGSGLDSARTLVNGCMGKKKKTEWNESVIAVKAMNIIWKRMRIYFGEQLQVWLVFGVSF